MRYLSYWNSSITAVLLFTVLPACSGTDLSKFKGIGSSILTKTGYVSNSSADAILDSGAKLQKGLSGFTEQEEYHLGRGVAALILSKYKPISNPTLSQYVNQVGATLVAASERPYTYGGYHFLVLDSDEVNAVSAPGGFVFISKGFLKILASEDALAAVLAHEIGHIVAGHASASISQSNISDAILSAAKETAKSQGGFYTQELTNLFGDSIQEIGDKLLINGFSRGQEYESDAYALKLMNAVGYDPQALLQVLEQLQKLETSNQGGWFKTHPEAEDRIDEIDIEKAPDNADVAIRLTRFNNAIRTLAR